MANKAIFFDRDDTLIEDPGYINHPDQVKLLDGAGSALCELRMMGYKLIVITNQSGIARGIVTEEVLNHIHHRLKELLGQQGAYLNGIYYCPYHPEGVIEKYRKESDLRKPNPGMLIKAAEEMDIDLSQSWSIGDGPRDIAAGLAAGCRTILINSKTKPQNPEQCQPAPNHRAVNIKEAVNIIKQHHRTTQPKSVQEKNGKITPPKAPSEPAMEQEIENAATGKKQPTDDTQQTLADILHQLKRLQRKEMFSEFSITKMLAGVLQTIALFCVLLSVWFLIGPGKNSEMILIPLGFGIVLQLMALTFYIMNDKK